MHIRFFYQTHLTEGQWSYINKVFFENDCRHRKYSLRSIFEAVLYLLVSGCQWRMLPHDFPKWQTVYWYFHKWRTDGYLSHCIEKLIMKIRRKRRQSATPSVMATASSSADTSAVPGYMIPDSHLRCVNRFLMHGLRSGKDLLTVDIAVSLLRI